MRGLSLLLVTLLATVALSGCIQGLLPQDPAPPPAPPAGPDWVQLPLPTALDVGGLFGVWVPDGATGLRMATLDTDDPPPYFDPDDFEATNTRATPMPRLLVVHDPSGVILAAGDGRLDLGPVGGANTSAMQADPRIFLDVRDPAPGLYLIALYGGHEPPLVQLRVDADTDVYPILPVGMGWQRHLLAGTADLETGNMREHGELLPPAHTMRADVDLAGYGVQGDVTLVNATGGLVAAHHATLPAVPGEDEFVPLLYAPFLVRDFDSRPTAATRDLWRWDVALMGSGHAFAWTGQAADLAPPAPLQRDRPLAEGVLADDAADSIPLAGVVAPGSGAWFTLDEAARIRPTFADDRATYENGQMFRVYDETGARLVWDVIPDDARAYALPAGTLLIVNDGYADLTVDVLDGAALADAALHEAAVEIVEANIGLPVASAGYTVESTSVHLPGPVSGVIVSRYDDLFTEYALTFTDLGGRVTANFPVAGFDGPVHPYFCCVGGPGYDEFSTPWMDGGRYRITASAIDIGSAAGLDIEIVTFVLDGGVAPDGEPNPIPGR